MSSCFNVDEKLFMASSFESAVTEFVLYLALFAEMSGTSGPSLISMEELLPPGLPLLSLPLVVAPYDSPAVAAVLFMIAEELFVAIKFVLLLDDVPRAKKESSPSLPKIDEPAFPILKNYFSID